MEKDLFRVDIALKDSQREKLNVYNFTHCGEPKKVLDRHVRFYMEDLKNINDTFIQDEIESLVVTWSNSNFVNGPNGEKLFY